MKKEIRKALLEIKEKKDNIILERMIAEKRIMMILETKENLYNFKKIPYEKRVKMSFLLMQEFAYLQKNSLLSEQIVDILKSIFGGGIFQNLFSGSVESFAEPILNSILTKFGFKSQGVLKKFVISVLTSNPSTLIDAFSDCKKFTNLVAKSIAEALVMMVQDSVNMNSPAYNVIRNTMGGVSDDSEVITAIEGRIGNSICDFFDEYSEKAKSLIAKLKAN